MLVIHGAGRVQLLMEPCEVFGCHAWDQCPLTLPGCGIVGGPIDVVIADEMELDVHACLGSRESSPWRYETPIPPVAGSPPTADS